MKQAPNKIGNLVVGLDEELILSGEKLALKGDKLGVARTGEVKLVEGIIDESRFITDVGWVQGFIRGWTGGGKN